MKSASLSLARGVLIFAFAIVLWQAIVWLTGVPHFILPGPQRVFERLWDAREMIAENAVITFAEIIGGMVLGAALGVSTAIQLVMSPFSRIFMRPVIVFAQAVPVFALAPIITLWLGYGMASKILIVILVIYFPIASSFFDGMMRTPQGYLDLARVMDSKPLNTIFHLRLPHAMPGFASGLRLAAVYAPFGAVIGEWVGASRGLGHLMLLANGRAQTDLMFASLFILAAFTVLLYNLVDRLGVVITRRYGEPVG